eukprot:scaffold14832_cov129-Isochrysis_galbana.AAC.10
MGTLPGRAPRAICSPPVWYWRAFAEGRGGTTTLSRRCTGERRARRTGLELGVVGGSALARRRSHHLAL